MRAYAVKSLCGLLGVSTQAYYKHDDTQMRKMAEEAFVVEFIKSIRERDRGIGGGYSYDSNSPSSWSCQCAYSIIVHFLIRFIMMLSASFLCKVSASRVKKQIKDAVFYFLFRDAA